MYDIFLKQKKYPQPAKFIYFFLFITIGILSPTTRIGIEITTI